MKLRHLLLAGLGALTAKYYMDKPEKINEHKEIVKEKLDQTVQYSQFLVNYAQKNGAASSLEYVKNDVNKLVQTGLDNISSDSEGPLHYGRQLLNDRANVRENFAQLKEKGAELGTKVSDASKVLKEEVSPLVANYKANLQDSLAKIKDRTQEIKTELADSKTAEKISNFSTTTKEKLNETKTKIEEIKTKK
ncbi:MAG: hypothetical protein Q3988_05795 [Gemella sp.]|nr:hypothetical protein [Gemella sp.]